MIQKTNKLCRFLIVFLLIISSNFAYANAAQPGIWNAGGSGVFSLLYPDDTASFKKIQMQSEQVYMKLYPGFAVVKGVYHFYNDQDSTISLKIGYPINNVFESKRNESHRNQVVFKELYSIKATWNGNQSTPIIDSLSNWYVWNANFQPKSTTTFSIYFIVSTNNASQSQGYNKEYQNAFIYLIETGFIWKSPIDSGDFYVYLDSKIDTKSIKTNQSGKVKMNSKNNTLYFQMKNYGYTPDKNLVITYHERVEEFQIENILQLEDKYFKEIDRLSKDRIKDNEFSPFHTESPYEIDGAGNMVSWIFYLAIYGLPILASIILIILLFKIFKYLRRKKTV